MGKFYVLPWIYAGVFALTCVRRKNNQRENVVGLRRKLAFKNQKRRYPLYDQREPASNSFIERLLSWLGLT